MIIALIIVAPTVPDANAADVAAISEATSDMGGDLYRDYTKWAADYPDAEAEVVLNYSNMTEKSNKTTELTNYLENTATAVLLNQGCTAVWDFDIPVEARYGAYIKFVSHESAASRTTLEFCINGEFPFREAGFIELDKLWSNGEIIRDVLDNDISTSPVEYKAWQEIFIPDPSKMSSDPMNLALQDGENSLSINIISGSIAIEYIKLMPIPKADSYAKYYDGISGRTDNSAQSGIKIIEAQESLYSSDIQITPINDAASPYTSPQRAGKIVMNAIGGGKWQNVGQKITWEVRADNTGYYKIAYRARQRSKQGVSVTRSILVNGISPFTQAKTQVFDYARGWYMQTVSADNEDCLFYFEKDKTYLFTVEVELGTIRESLDRVDQVITNLNQAYLNMLMIVGASPDIYRDYDFRNTLPETMRLLEEQLYELRNVTAILEESTEKGQFTSFLHNVIYQLDKMTEKPALIAGMFNDFKTNIGALGAWAAEAKTQPLELDRIFIIPKNTDVPKEQNNFFTNMSFAVKCFFLTFVTDYSMVAQTDESLGHNDKIKVWLASGRDQAQIIKRLSDRQFTPEHKVNTNIELIGAGTLLPSVLAGVGPDVSLMNTQTDPVNYAVRNAVYNLSKFDDLDEILTRFNPNASIPFQFNGNTYALPETFSFMMFFYRKDIFANLNQELPKTWDELLKLVPKFQQYKMEIGLPAMPTVTQGYYQILYQRDIPIYNEDGKTSNLDSDEAMKAFSDYCEQFTVFGAPAVYDFVNRFRTGEMPCAVVDYTMYNTLNLYAPEIKGLWDFIPVPGVYKKDGSFEHTSVAISTASMIMSSTKKPKESWEFIKWWLSAETQSRFAVELESVLGSSAKYTTANTEAFEKMTWTVSQKNNILKQMKDVKAVPEVPGGYYTTRILDFAFNTVYTANTNPADTLAPYIKELNGELGRKRTEFGLR